MKLRNIALTLAVAFAGTAFAATSTETTVTKQTPLGTVTKHTVKVKPSKHRVVKRTVVHHRHAARVAPRHVKVTHPHRKVVVVRNS